MFYIFLLVVGFFIISAFRWYAVIKAQVDKLPVTPFKLFFIFLSGWPLDYAIPSLGLSGQVGRSYLSSIAGMKKEVNVGSLSLEYVVRGIANLSAAVISIIVLVIYGFTQFSRYLPFAVLVTVGFIVGVFLLWKLLPRKYGKYRKVIRDSFKRKPGWVVVSFLSMYVLYGWAMLQIFAAAHFLGIDLSLFQIVVFYFVTSSFNKIIPVAIFFPPFP